MSECVAIRAFLNAAGYTPASLAVDMNISRKAAKRVLYGEHPLTDSDCAELEYIFGMRAEAIYIQPDSCGNIRRRIEYSAELVSKDLKQIRERNKVEERQWVQASIEQSRELYKRHVPRELDELARRYVQAYLEESKGYTVCAIWHAITNAYMAMVPFEMYPEEQKEASRHIQNNAQEG